MHLHSDFKFYLGLSIELCTSQVWYSKYACLKERTQEICPYPVQIISTYPSSLPFFPRKCRKMPQPHGVSRSIFHDACLFFIDLSFSHCKKADRFRSCQYVACHQQTPPGTVKDACICLLTFYMLLFSWRIRIAILTQLCIMLWLLWSKSQKVISTSIPNSKARPHLNENCVQLWFHSGLDRCCDTWEVGISSLLVVQLNAAPINRCIQNGNSNSLAA
jgi:hypothetical protein